VEGNTLNGKNKRERQTMIYKYHDKAPSTGNEKLKLSSVSQCINTKFECMQVVYAT